MSTLNTSTDNPNRATIPTAQLAQPPRFSRGWFAMGITLIAVGCVWLLASLGYLPDINWVWVLTLFILGLVPLLAAGLNKLTFISGGFFFAASIASVLRQTGKVTINVEVPTLIIIAGVLTLIAMALRLQTPSWLLPRRPIAYPASNESQTARLHSSRAA
jgi:hypothetical protein